MAVTWFSGMVIRADSWESIDPDMRPCATWAVASSAAPSCQSRYVD